MDWTCIIFGLLFMGAGIAFYKGNIHSRTGAWKNMSEDEKATILIEPLCKNIGTMVAICGLFFLMKGLFGWFSGYPFLISMIVWFALCWVDVYYIEKSGRYVTGKETKIIP